MIEAIRNDTRRGASELVRDALAAFGATIDETPPGTPLQPRLENAARAILGAQPAMAPLLALSCNVVRGAAASSEPGIGARQAILEFAARLDRIAREVPERSEALIPAGGRVLTLSASSTARNRVTPTAAPEASR